MRLAAEEGGFAYVSDTYDDDLPYWLDHDGHGNAIPPQLVIPYTLDANDMRFATPQGFNSGDQFFAYLKDAFDTLHAEGEAGRPKMMSVGLHCRLIGRPGRAAALKRFVDYVKGHDQRLDRAAHRHRRALARAPPLRRAGAAPEPHGPRRSSSSNSAASSSIRPGSPRAPSSWSSGPAHDTAGGLHNALCRVFRSASDATERLGVLAAHPDLAGKLAAAKRLTPESASEQASAGLDALTDAERARFTALNDAYVKKFGFPFIIAVKGLSKAEILAAFESRIANDRAAEFAAACRQVERIALLRLKDMLPQ